VRYNDIGVWGSFLKRGNDARCVIEISGGGRKNRLKAGETHFKGQGMGRFASWLLVGWTGYRLFAVTSLRGLIFMSNKVRNTQ